MGRGRKVARSLRILCAAASSGQEPYSLALTIAEAKIAAEGWKTEILGIDLDAKILKRAEGGVYSQFEVQRGLPVTMLMKHFTPNTDNLSRESFDGGWADIVGRSLKEFIETTNS